MLKKIKDAIMPEESFEQRLDKLRREIAKATTSASLAEIRKQNVEVFSQVDEAIETLDDEIAIEADNVDRSRTNDLRAKKSALCDILTDAENLRRRLDELHKQALASENEASAMVLSEQAKKKRLEALTLLASLVGPLEAIVAASHKFEELKRVVDANNKALEDMGRAELKSAKLFEGLGIPGESIEHIFNFVRSERFDPPSVVSNSLLSVARRAKEQLAK
ncbi:hypothetical protein [Ciceribacter selenitireducens]